MDTNSVAPGAGRFDHVTGLAETELRPLQELLGIVQTCQQRFEIGHHQRGGTTQHLHPPRRQMELSLADINPHVFQTGHQVWVPGKSQAHQIVSGRERLIRYRHIDVTKLNDIAEIFDSPVKSRSRHHVVHPWNPLLLSPLLTETITRNRSPVHLTRRAARLLPSTRLAAGSPELFRRSRRQGPGTIGSSSIPRANAGTLRPVRSLIDPS